MIRLLIHMLAMIWLSACTPAQKPHPIVAAYSQAYNDQDLAAMKALMHPDIEWMSVKGEQIEVEALSLIHI